MTVSPKGRVRIAGFLELVSSSDNAHDPAHGVAQVIKRSAGMNASQPRRRISIWLDTEYYAFVEKFMMAGTFESRDELFEAALDALIREIEACARQAAAEEGHQNAEDASLEELADMLDQSWRWREH